MFFYTLTSTRFALYLVAFALSLVYMWMPFFVNYIFLPSDYFFKVVDDDFYFGGGYVCWILSAIVGFSFQGASNKTDSKC